MQFIFDLIIILCCAGSFNMLSRLLYVIKYTETTTDVITSISTDQKWPREASNHSRIPSTLRIRAAWGGTDAAGGPADDAPAAMAAIVCFCAGDATSATLLVWLVLPLSSLTHWCATPGQRSWGWISQPRCTIGILEKIKVDSSVVWLPWFAVRRTVR
jgi:hypothetical protein